MRSLLRRATVERIAVIVWFVVCIALVAKNAVTPDSHSLYPQYARAARALAGTDATGSIYSVQHLPFFADLLYPFSLFPDRIGSNLWLLTSLAMLISGLRAIVTRFWPDGDRPRAQAWIFLVVLILGLASLANNQSNIIITGCLLWGAVAVRDGRWWLAAACLAAPGFKMYPLALGLLYSALFPGRFAWRFACTLCVILVIPYVLHPTAIVSERYSGVFEYVTGNPHSQTYVLMNVRDFLVRWGWPIGSKLFLSVQAMTGMTIVGVLVRCRRRGVADAAVVWHGFVLTTLWFVTFGPSVESQTILLAAPAIALVFVETWNRSRTSAAAVACATALIVIGPLQTSLFGLAAQRAIVGAKVACPVLVAVWCWQLLSVWRRASHRLSGVTIRFESKPVRAVSAPRAA